MHVIIFLNIYARNCILKQIFNFTCFIFKKNNNNLIKISQMESIVFLFNYDRFERLFIKINSHIRYKLTNLVCSFKLFCMCIVILRKMKKN